MSVLARFAVYMLIGIIVIFLAAVLGDNGPWYFAWLVGTVMIVLISTAGGVLLDTQEEEKENAGRR
jgi:FtsH-binding integral membrane protein